MIDRELVITYGGFQCGGSLRDFQPHGRYRHTRSRTTAEVEFDMLVTGDTDAAFAGNCAVAEAAFRDPWRSLVIQMGPTTLVSYSSAPKHAAEPSIRKAGNPDADTGRSRLYTVTVRIDLSADVESSKTGSNGLRDSSVDLEEEPSGRKRITISGTYTAVGDTNARDRFDAAIDSYCSAVLSALSISESELVGTPRSVHDTVNHTLDFTRTYEELLYEQAGASSGLDSTKLVRQRVVFRRLRSDERDTETAAAAGGTGGTSQQGETPLVRKLDEYTISYDAVVRRGNDPKTVYDNEIRSWLLSQFTEVWPEAGTRALVSESVQHTPDDPNISVQLRWMAASDGQDVIERSITISDEDSDDEALVKAWTGDRFSRYKYDVPTDLVRTVTLVEHVIGDVDLVEARTRLKNAFPEATGGTRDAGGGRWSRGRVSPSVRKVELGIGDEDTMTISEVSGTLRRTYYKAVSATVTTPSASTG